MSFTILQKPSIVTQAKLEVAKDQHAAFLTDAFAVKEKKRIEDEEKRRKDIRQRQQDDMDASNSFTNQMH
jgi:hypothetical protein